MFDLQACLRLFSMIRQRLEENCERLNQLDSVVGDGDHGFTVCRAFTAVEVALSKQQFNDCAGVFDSAAQALAENTGGAIGPILAAFFAAGGLVFQSKAELSAADMAQFLGDGLEAVMAVGGARPGEKTLVDALAPAVDALQSVTADSCMALFAVAEKAARKGAQASADMLAGHGRARFVGERSLGYEDAGAHSMVLIINAFYETALGNLPNFRQSDQILRDDQVVTQPPGKLINQPEVMVQEDLEGFALAYPTILRLTGNGILVRTSPKERGKVGLAIGHGGGHTPAMGGFVGYGLLDADACGPIFTCASGIKISQAIVAADCGAGVALLVSNHTGDVLNARLAEHRARQAGIEIESILLGDDIATAPREKLAERRGLGGMLFALKIGGGAAEAGQSLKKVVELMRKTNQRTATLAVAVRPPTHPATGKPLFDLPVGQIEVGTGVHGEVGVYQGRLLSADAIIDLLLTRLVNDLTEFTPHKMLVFLNGSGGTSLMELHILYRRIHHFLGCAGLDISGSVIGSFFTTQEMGGFSVSLLAVDDELMFWWHSQACGACLQLPLSRMEKI